jgi:hypothetical protein
MWRKHQLLEDLLASFHWKAWSMVVSYYFINCSHLNSYVFKPFHYAVMGIYIFRVSTIVIHPHPKRNFIYLAIVIALTGPIIGIRALSYNGNQQRKN